MRTYDSLRTAITGVSVHKNRSLLTILGIVIGITSIVAIMSIGQSAQNLVVSEIQKFGSTNVFIVPGRQPKGPSDGAATLLNDSLKLKDYEDLSKKSNVPGAKSVIPYTFGLQTLSYESETYDSMIIGSTELIEKNFDLNVGSGNFFELYDVEQKSKVVVIGDKVREELFGNENPIGKKIKIKEQKFKVIGVLEPEGQGSFVDFNKAVISPYTSVQQDILGIRYFQRIVVDAISEADVPGVITDVESLLRDNHNIDDPEKDDFFVQTQEGMAEQVKTVTGILTVLLSSVAAISLVVGGIGIMNIMLVSVTERTKEIGLRKALGARNRDILVQFIIEALLLTVSGGIIGILFGTGLTGILSYVAQQFANIDLPFVFSVSGALLGVGVSCAIGLGFGIFPARAASKKSPVESLYYE